MDKAEITIFIIIANIVLFVFLAAFIIFISQYRRRKMLHNKEKETMNLQHTKDLLATQLEIQQLTMQEIGREIHDSVGQKLTLASLYAQQLSHQNQAPAINHKIENIGQIINESLQELRSLSKSLTGVGQAQVGNLKALLEAECSRINDAGLCHASVESNLETITVPQPNCNVLLRILQEFLQNSLKHANCGHIQILLQQNDGKTSIIAVDDGLGFDIKAMENNSEKGIGLHNMKRRAELIGALLKINSEISKGTKMEVTIPQ